MNVWNNSWIGICYRDKNGLQNWYAESKLVDALRANHKAIISLVAAAGDGQVLGHILFSPVSTTPPSEVKGIGLAPVAVREDIQ